MRVLSRYSGFALLLVSLAPSMRADATLRYHTDIQTTSLIPAGSLDTILAGMRDMVVQIKGNKAYSSQGMVTSIMDLTTQDVIMIDAPNKRFASIPAGQYGEQAKTALPEIPDAAKAMLASMKTNVESHVTGRTAVIQGIQTEEREYILTVDMAMPGVTSTASPFMKMVMQVWTAKPEEAQRIPALQEYKNYTSAAGWSMNLAQTLKQITTGLPGMGDNFGTMLDEMTKNGAMSLRMHTEIVMPMLALLAKQAPAGQLPAGFDANAPLMQMNQELVELSTAPLDNALFEVPADYQQTSLAVILKGAVPVPPPSFK